MTDSVTHVAGLTIEISTRVIQRCQICGYKLCDNLNTSTSLNEDGSIPKFPTWETSRLIRVTEGNPVHFELLAESDKLPFDSCITLVED